MAGEIKKDKEGPTDLQVFMSQGWTVATNLRVEASIAHKKGEAAESAESKLINYERSRAIETAAERIEQALSFLGKRLHNLRHDPEP